MELTINKLIKIVIAVFVIIVVVFGAYSMKNYIGEFWSGVTFKGEISSLSSVSGNKTDFPDVLAQKIIEIAKSNLGNKFDHCWHAVDSIYNQAGASRNCVWSEKNKIHPYVGSYKKYQENYLEYQKIGGVGNKHPDCDNQRSSNYKLKTGDFLQVYNGNKYTGEHNLIFEKWEDESNKIAWVYDQGFPEKGLEHRKVNLEKWPVEVIFEPTPKGNFIKQTGRFLKEIIKPTSQRYPDDKVTGE